MQINLSLVLLVVASCGAEHELDLLKNVAKSEGPLFAKKSEMMGKTKFLVEEETLTQYIAKGEPKMFVYLLQWEVPCLTITVTSCGVPLAWSIKNTNESGVKVDMNLSGWSPNEYETRTRIYEERLATPRAYQVAVAVATSGYVQVFVSIAGPIAELRPNANLTVTPRRHKGQLSVRWPPRCVFVDFTSDRKLAFPIINVQYNPIIFQEVDESSVDPHAVSYYLVVNASPVPSLCAAEALTGHEPTKRINERADTRTVTSGILTIEPLGSRTSSIIRGLLSNQSYSVQVFVFNNLTGLSYLYSATRARYTRTRPIPLRDGRQMEANLRKLDGRATFRYKVPKNTPTGGRLEWYVAVCGTGTTVDAEIRHKRKPIIERREIVGYATISLENPTPGATYILRLNSTEPEMLARIAQVQVMATTKGLQEPVLPRTTTLKEDKKSERTCKSVQLIWLPSSHSPTATTPTDNRLTYCITTKEVQKFDYFTPTPDQCAHALVLKNHDYSANLCFRHLVNRKAITYTVGHLKPGKFYDMQVAVRNANSRVLSYQKIRVRTKQRC